MELIRRDAYPHTPQEKFMLSENPGTCMDWSAPHFNVLDILSADIVASVTPGVLYRHECDVTRTWDEAVVGCDHTTIQQVFIGGMGANPQIFDEQAIKDQCKVVLMDYDPLLYASQRKAFAYHHPFAFPANAVFSPPLTIATATTPVLTSTRRRLQTALNVPATCIPYQIIAASDFEDGNIDGWVNGKTDYAPNFSKFLGRFGLGGATTAEKTFSGIPTDVEEISFEYDMYEIDSWDSDTFNVRYNRPCLSFCVYFFRDMRIDDNTDISNKTHTHHLLLFRTTGLKLTV
jgi:hypothetical protein